MVDCLLVDKSAQDHPVVRRFLDRFPDARVVYRERDDGSPAGPMAMDAREPVGREPPCPATRTDRTHAGSVTRIDRPPLHTARRTVFLKHHNGSFLKRFPDHEWYGDGGTCHYSLILGYNCFCSCRYCFIQTIFDHAIPTLYANTDEMIDELRSFLSTLPDAWISTGEYLDSFQLDEVTRFNELLMDVFRDFPESTLELRTKIDSADHLPTHPPTGVLVSYSINPPGVVRRVEPGTAGFARRMAKASSLHTKGYRIALRIDPIIPTDVFCRDYSEMPALVEKHFGWDCVEKVFLGALRFDDDLLRHMSRSPDARHLLNAEYVPCPDGHYRLFQNARVDSYRSIVNAIRRHRPDIEFALTMEPEYVRRRVLAR